ncbi:bile acid:sodium symporter [Sphingobium sp. SCG-1]|uniref:bile acid:sodium symporter family protein n=1 Tax=Sphingobium sp. SCG-1 TaxID=2072936 RepID=UPI000CD69D15|nr:bile acid:sodium symporter family protein [Sphingobium sp. SCG-1]AUW58324.1 bile acid:sodium symporter [Sphingobium sp. SCG-1]
MALLRSLLDPFVVLLLATVALASFLPAKGDAARIVDGVADAGIVLLFFLHGAKLSRSAIIAGASNWRLQLLTPLVTFAIFPLLGIGLSEAAYSTGIVLPMIASGLLFLTLLPSTVQSSIAFTSIAGGNVAAAVCAASFSNIAGIILTPLLTGLLMHLSAAGQSDIWASAEVIAMHLLLPFVLGHLARPWISGFVARHSALVGRVDRGAILLIVYSAFSAAVVEGLWQKLSPAAVLVICGLCIALLAVVLTLSWFLGKAAGLAVEDRIVLLFCGSKKSLASGVPMAGALFPASQVGLLILPLMLFHQIQLIACAVIARRLAPR